MTVVSVAATTHVGVARTENQDCLHVGGWSSQRSGARLELDVGSSGVVAVVDGMGGHVGGRLASWTAARALDDLRLDAATDPAAVNRILQQVSDAVRAHGAATVGHGSMGATIAGFVVTGRGLLLFNVGDCSILRVRDGYVGQLAAIDRVEGADRSGIVAQCLGGTPHPTAVDAHAVWFSPVGRERLVLCSDGLTDCVPNSEIALLVEGVGSLGDIAASLVAAAVRRGAPDNISVIVAEVSVDRATPVVAGLHG